jgi:hypothetical protein
MFTDSQIESTIDIVIGQLYGQPETSPLAADVIRHLGGIDLARSGLTDPMRNRIELEVRKAAIRFSEAIDRTHKKL